MRNLIVVDEADNQIEKHEISFHPFLPRIGESVSVIRYVPGNVRYIDGVKTGIDYFSVVDKIDKYKVIDIEHIISPSSNNMTQIDIKITVQLKA